MPLRDKYCQTDHHHHGCCEPVYILEPGDPPLLQQPVQTSKSGIQQIIECFRSGTKQLKHILLKDVDTIFECKLCRSLFRGLPNLITHKKFYCPPSLQMDDNLPDVNDKQSQAISDLLEAIYPRVDKREYIIKLEPIETNQNAVFQYISRTDNPAEVTESSSTPEQTEVQIQETSSEQPKAVPEADTEVEEAVEPPPVETVADEATAPTEEQPQESQADLETSDSSDLGHQLICCLCRKEFNSRRGVRRHIRKVHKKKMEELKKYIETRKTPNQSSKGRNAINVERHLPKRLTLNIIRKLIRQMLPLHLKETKPKAEVQDLRLLSAWRSHRPAAPPSCARPRAPSPRARPPPAAAPSSAAPPGSASTRRAPWAGRPPRDAAARSRGRAHCRTSGAQVVCRPCIHVSASSRVGAPQPAPAAAACPASPDALLRAARFFSLPAKSWLL